MVKQIAPTHFLNRNQATRVAIQMFEFKGSPVVFYVMPNGALYVNRLFEGDNYAAVSFKSLLKWVAGDPARKQAVINAFELTIDEIENGVYGKYGTTWDRLGHSQLSRKIKLYKDQIVQIQNLLS